MQKACVVIPCYNEAERLDLGEFDEFIASDNNIDLLFVNDGSSDDTQAILEKYKEKHPARVSVLNLPVNSGKAEAVRLGVLKVAEKKGYDFFGFWDADLATPLADILYFIEELKHRNRKIAIGSRIKRLGAFVQRKKSRHFLGRIFSTFASIILKMPVYDTQCGAKIFKIELHHLFSEKFITGWLFDIELLARYRNLFGNSAALNDVLEVPVNAWIEKGGSKLKLKHLIKVPFELLAIYKKYN